MAVVKSLTILMKGKTDRLKKDLNKGEKMVQGFGGRVKRILKGSLLALGGALVGGALIRGFVRQIREAMTELDALQKRSRGLGINASELSKLELAADLAGISTDQFATAQKRLNQTISQANFGLSTYTRAFDALGVDYKKLQQLSPTKQLVELAAAFEKVEDRARRIDLAVTLFGRQGMQMFNLLEGGAEGLQATFDKARRLGLVFNSAELRQVEEANDAMNLLDRTFNAFWQRIAINLAPALESLAEALSNIGPLAQWVGHSMSEWAGVLNTVVGKVKDLNRELGFAAAILENIGRLDPRFRIGLNLRRQALRAMQLIGGEGGANGIGFDPLANPAAAAGRGGPKQPGTSAFASDPALRILFGGKGRSVEQEQLDVEKRQLRTLEQIKDDIKNGRPANLGVIELGRI